jgi:hypothetical protein
MDPNIVIVTIIATPGIPASPTLAASDVNL